MNKRTLGYGIAAALVGICLLWAAGSASNRGISGWETLNVSMEQAVGASAAAVKEAAAEGESSSLHAAKGAEAAAVAGEGGWKSGEAVSAGNSARAESVSSNGQQVIGTDSIRGNSGESVPGSNTGTDSSGARVAGAAATVSAATPPAAMDGRVNVNTAASAELMGLPGIGEKKAQAIIDYRDSTGGFRTLSDLGKVKGIGPKMLEKLKPLVSF